jgi:hypothetical protein
MIVPTLSVDQLITPLTPKEVKTTIYDILETLEVSTTNWKPGAVVRLIIAVVSVLGSALSVVGAALARSAFIGLAAGAWLRIVARDTFGTTYLPATFATGTITLTNSQGGSFTINPRDLLAENPSTGAQYRNTNADPVTLDGHSSVTLTFEAVKAGAAYSTGVGTVLRLVTSLTGVTISNPTPFVGRDDESDAQLAARAQMKPRSLSVFGTREAYKSAALAATRLADGSLVGVNRVAVSNSSTVGTTYVWVATPLGAVSGSADDPATDLGVVHAAMQRDAQPVGPTLITESAVPYTLNVTFRVALPAGVAVALEERVRIATDALLLWLGSDDMPIGGLSVAGWAGLVNLLPRETAIQVVAQAFIDAGYGRPLAIDMLAPSGDIHLSPNEVVQLGLVVALP